MRFLIMIKADPCSEADLPSCRQRLREMARYNGELAKAGVLLAADGLYPSRNGARVRVSGQQRTVVEGPFGNAAEPHQLVAGFWLIQVKSREEAIEWVKRCPNPGGGELEFEVRQVFDSGELCSPGPRAETTLEQRTH